MGSRERKKYLREMGFSSYKEYLRSSFWGQIRDLQLKKQPWCCGCGMKASQVHHLSYDKRTLSGKSENRLVSVCATCHKDIEFDDQGNKTTIHEANVRLLKKMRSSKHAMRKNSQAKAKRDAMDKRSRRLYVASK